ncbi:MAG: sodium-dependent transporter [Candidatus Micrarchaeota archaeon]|nr:sodium-dependent transporter [Candidatus Micrarchaeota archaeon]
MARLSDSWGSGTAFIFASIGAAVGLGNIWRFPYIATEHGGIWFLVPYVVCLLLIGIPLFMLEAGQGLLSRKGFVQSIERSKDVPFVNRSARKALGIVPVFVSTAILSYYMVLCGWTLWLALSFVVGHRPTFAALQSGYMPALAFIGIFAFGYAVVAKGVRKGIEPFTDKIIPLLFLALATLFIYALTLPGALSHVGNLFSGSPYSILDGKTWYYALSQSLFSLSVGYGIIFTTSIYLKKGKGIFGSAFLVAGADTAASLLMFVALAAIAGFIGTSASGLPLSFEVLPAFFAAKGMLDLVVGAVFFALLFAAAFTSVLAMMEHTRTSIGFLSDGWKTVIWICVFLAGLLAALSYTPLSVSIFGKPVLDQMDFVFGTFMAPFAALAVAFGCAYLLPHERVAKAIGVPENQISFFVLLVKKVIPISVSLLIIFSQLSGIY